MTNEEFYIKLVAVVNEAKLAGVAPAYIIGALQITIWQEGYGISFACQKQMEMAQKIGEMIPEDAIVREPTARHNAIVDWQFGNAPIKQEGHFEIDQEYVDRYRAKFGPLTRE